MPEENTIPDTLAVPSKTAKFGIGTMGMFLVFSAAVQYNDPDPYAWLALYLAAAGVSFAALWFPVSWKIPVVVAVGAFVWAATLVPAVMQTSFPALFQSWEMMSREMEEGREFLGLLSVASWTTYLAHLGRKAQQ
mgnify:FL=1|tara:strand:- start:101 stop:505 length:405 start_codon:yes stop_codon:yes gene_type:complete